MGDKQSQILSSLVEKPPSFTGENDAGDGLKWFKQIERLRNGLKLTDTDVLFVVGNRLKGRAEVWWNNNENSITTWDEFEKEFKKSFAPDESAIDLWWNQMINLKQRKDQSVENLKIQFDELCNLLESAGEELSAKYKMRHFRKALKRDIIYELDRAPPSIRTDWEAMIKEAKRIETNFKRYDIIDDEEFHGNTKRGPPVASKNGNSSTVSEASSDISTVIRELCNDMKELKITISNNGSVYNSQSSYGRNNKGYNNNNNVFNPNYLKCYTCGGMGHKAIHWKREGAAVSGRDAVAHDIHKHVQETNQNTITTNPTKINAIMVVPEFEDINEENAPINIYNLGKRTRSQNSDPAIQNTADTSRQARRNRNEQIAGTSHSQTNHNNLQLPSIQNILNQNVVTNTNNETSSNNAVSGKRIKTKRLRAPPRRIAVTNEKVDSDIWKKLEIAKIEVSLKEWIINNKESQRDLRDGTRFLLDLIGDSEQDTDFYSEDDDTDYDYPYDLNVMKRSTPLRAPITIYDHKIEAIFDSGASVSLISRALAKRLRLLPNGDTIPIASVDDKRNSNTRNDPRCRSDITLSVPIRVAGKLRPEHMVISDDCEDDTCILGMTWFKQFDVTQKLKENIIIIPTKGGKSRIRLQGKSTIEKPSKQARVYTISIREIEDDKDTNDTNPKYTNNNFDKLITYDEEITGDKEIFDTNPELTATPSSTEENTPEEIKHFIKQFSNSFAENSGLGKISKEYEHIIELKNPNELIKTKPYRLTWEEDTHLKEELKQLLEKGLIRPSKGRWTSPVFFVQKKDKGLRLVVDFRKLNKNTKKMVYPLPHINELLDSLGGATVFSTLDAASGYWQVPLHEDSIEKTGFITKYGTYEFLVMPFGLCTASDTYQRMMSSLMAPFIGRFVFVFIDDIIVYSKNIDEHLTHLRTVFETCNAANLRLKRSKCHFACESVEYLGHIVSAKGVLPTSRNVSKLTEMKTPSCVSEVRSLLGTTNYYRRYIQNYAALMRPITRLLKKEETFIWDKEQENAFIRVKQILSNPPILSYPDQNQVQMLTTDGCSTGIGAILSQSPDGSMKEV
ncbi:hypothetical protein G6F68_009191 [Rhizopus microsporus]|nr:hypothetical protein G6F68_009191 [Rhizopus microsporus]